MQLKKLSLNILSLLSLELEAGEASRTNGRQPLYDEVRAKFAALESAVSQGQVSETASQLLLLAMQLEPNQRSDAMQIHRRMIQLKQEETPAGVTDSLFHEALDCANEMRSEALRGLLTNATNATNEARGHHPKSATVRATTRTPVIHAQHMNIHLAGNTIVEDVNVSIAPGEIVGLIGQNGSGKSTVLKALASHLDLTSDAVTYPALRQEFTRRSAILNEVMLVGQRPLVWRGVVEKNLRLYAALRGVARKDNADQVAYAIRLLQLTEFRQHRFGELSDGYRTRFELAKAFVSYPKVLLLDEPFAPLDALGRRWYARVLREMADSRGIAIVVTAQEVSQLYEIADDILVVDAKQVQPLDNFMNNDRSVYEILTDGSQADILSALKEVPDLKFDFGVLPTRLYGPKGLSATTIVKGLTEAGLLIRLFRDVSGVEDIIGRRSA